MTRKDIRHSAVCSLPPNGSGDMAYDVLAMELTPKQIEILDFTLYHSSNGLYCCSFDDPDMKQLIADGLMTKVARASFVPSQEGYFGITTKGSRTLRGMTAHS